MTFGSLGPLGPFALVQLLKIRVSGNSTLVTSISGSTTQYSDTRVPRFLMIKQNADSDEGAAPPSLVVVQHWHDELKRLVPNN